MAELPKSWNLRTKKNGSGTLDIVGKDDAGKEYKVRSTEVPGVTERDVQEIAAVDRERTNARDFVKSLVGETTEKDYIEQIRSFDDNEWIAAAEPVVHAGMERNGSTVGYSRQYATNWDRVFKGA